MFRSATIIGRHDSTTALVRGLGKSKEKRREQYPARQPCVRECHTSFMRRHMQCDESTTGVVAEEGYVNSVRPAATRPVGQGSIYSAMPGGVVGPS